MPTTTLSHPSKQTSISEHESRHSQTVSTGGIIAVVVIGLAPFLIAAADMAILVLQR